MASPEVHSWQRHKQTGPQGQTMPAPLMQILLMMLIVIAMEASGHPSSAVPSGGLTWSGHVGLSRTVGRSQGMFF